MVNPQGQPYSCDPTVVNPIPQGEPYSCDPTVVNPIPKCEPSVNDPDIEQWRHWFEKPIFVYIRCDTKI